MQYLLATHPFRQFRRRWSSNAKQNRKGFFSLAGIKIGLVTLTLTLGHFGFASSALAEEPTTPSAKRVRELVHMVRQDCGSCHGLTLRGGLGPALLPDTLRDKPLASLKYTILLGRPGTAMPPWQPFLSEAEVDWILVQLLRGFPTESP